MFAAVAAFLLAGACSSGPLSKVTESADKDACAFKKPDEVTQQAGVLDEETLRQVAYCGSAQPRLWTGEDERKGNVIDADRINNAGRTKTRNRTGYVASFEQGEYEGGGEGLAGGPGGAGSAQALAQEIRSAGAKDFEPDERVTINFENQSLEFFIRQMLGGVLGVNYVANEALAGTVTFRTEKPVPKMQVIPIVRDILARNGQVMKLVNGVYHIGGLETIQAVERASLIGKSGELVTRVIDLKNRVSPNLGEVLEQIVPAGASASITPSGDKIVIKAAPEDIAQVESLVQALSTSRIGRDLVAIMPLAESSPSTVVKQVNEFLSAQAAAGSPILASVIPLENQLSVLIGAKGERTMNSMRSLIYRLDKDHGEGSELRIIPIKFLSAEEVANQLSGVFGESGGNAQRAPATTGNIGTDDGFRSNSGSTRRDRNRSSGTRNDGIRAPTLIANGDNGNSSDGGSDANGNGRAEAATGRSSGSRRAAGVAINNESVSIIADVRNNALLVHAPFKIFKRIREVVETLDVPLSQVVIEATIVEVTINDRLQYGVQTFLQGNGFAVRSSAGVATTDPGTSGLVANTTRSHFLGSIPGLGGVSVQMVLTALQEVTDVKVISSPYLTVLDGKSARLVIGDEIPFATRSQESNNQGTVTVTNEVETRDTGIIMTVSPKIRPDNSLILNIEQEVSSAAASAAAGDLTPIISTREISSDVSVQSGRTIVLGGLIQERSDLTESGVPVLKEVPLIGELFKQTQNNSQRIELLVLITPRVIRRSSQIEKITDLLRKQLSTY